MRKAAFALTMVGLVGLRGALALPGSSKLRFITIGPIQYQYVFDTKVPAGFDTTATHTIGIKCRPDRLALNLPRVPPGVHLHTELAQPEIAGVDR
jgi:hypothetical protein